MKRRRLSKEEAELWNKVASTAEPLRKTSPIPEAWRDVPAKPEVVEPAPIGPFSVGSKAAGTRGHTLLPPLEQEIAARPVQMDAKAFGRLKKGQLRPEARIDLHGMTVAEAHPVLIGFILNAHAQGKRLVLVITGKGKNRDDGDPIPTRKGILRHQLPHWLSLPPLRNIVLQVSTAHLRHGGGGAFYVYLRRPR